VLGDAATYSDIELSHDGSRAAVVVSDPLQRSSDIWVYDITRGLRTKLTFNTGSEFFPAWSANDSYILYTAQSALGSVLQKRSDGSGSEERLFDSGSSVAAPRSMSADGKFLSYQTGGPGSGDIWILPLAGERNPAALLDTPANEVNAQFSPDGRWLAYVSSESGRTEVYVMPFPGPGGKTLVSTAGGSQPRWRRNGNELFYISQDNKLMSATVDGRGSAFRVGTVTSLFDVSGRIGPRDQYDVTPDSQRFLFNMARNQSLVSTPPITLVVNWAAALKGSKVP
jgi:Tol biopolymer transport system component